MYKSKSIQFTILFQTIDFEIVYAQCALRINEVRVFKFQPYSTFKIYSPSK